MKFAAAFEMMLDGAIFYSGENEYRVNYNLFGEGKLEWKPKDFDDPDDYEWREVKEVKHILFDLMNDWEEKKHKEK